MEFFPQLQRAKRESTPSKKKIKRLGTQLSQRKRKRETLSLTFIFPDPLASLFSSSGEDSGVALLFPSFFLLVSLSLPVYLQLPRSLSLCRIKAEVQSRWSSHHLDTRTNRLYSEKFKMVNHSSTAAQTLHWWCVAEPILHCYETPCSGEFDGSSKSQQAYLNLLFNIVPSIPDESAQIVGTYFCLKTKTLLVDLSQTESFFKVMILNSHS